MEKIKIAEFEVETVQTNSTRLQPCLPCLLFYYDADKRRKSELTEWQRHFYHLLTSGLIYARGNLVWNYFAPIIP